MIDKPADRVYRGIADDNNRTNARILVMDDGSGPTERAEANLLYQLSPADPFWWGYGGGSPARTARAILEDVLPEAMPGKTLADLSRNLRNEIVLAFLHDFLANFHDSKEFWLPARTVVRWLHGLLSELRATYAPRPGSAGSPETPP